MGIFTSNARRPVAANLFQPGRDTAGGFGLPGVINGYGGGTFDIDGQQVTAPQREMMPQTPNALRPGTPSAYQPPAVDDGAMAFNGSPKMPNPMATLAGYDQGAAMQGQSGFAPMNEGFEPPAQKKPGFFSKGGPWIDVLGAIGDSLSGNPLYHNAKMQRMQLEQQHAKSLQARQWQIEDRDFKARQPEYFMSGRDRVRLNPSTGQADVVYDGLEDFDEYAVSMGYEPGTDEYETAVTDYVLRGNGPTALGIDMQLDDYRTKNNQRLDDYRTVNRSKVRAQPTYRDKNPRPTAPRTSRKAAPAVTATNPKTGETITVNSRGQWVDKNGQIVK